MAHYQPLTTVKTDDKKTILSIRSFNPTAFRRALSKRLCFYEEEYAIPLKIVWIRLKFISDIFFQPYGKDS